MYFDGWFFGRIDEVDRILRWVRKGMEEVWHGDPNLGSPASDLFYGVLFQGYGAPKGLSYDTGSSSPPVQVLDTFCNYDLYTNYWHVRNRNIEPHLNR